MYRLNFSPLRRTLAALMLIIPMISAWAEGVNTPYSMYGYGLLGDRATSMQHSMGGVGYAMNSGRQINTMNPASYAAIDSLTFLFDIGGNATAQWAQEINSAGKRVSDNNIGGGLDYVTMQFPLSRYMGMSIGLIPYSSVGYAFGNDIAHGAMENQGEGGINHAYLGIAGKWRGLSVGTNVAYAFGNIINRLYSTPDNVSVNGQTLFEHVMTIKDYDLLFGAQYNTRISKNSRLTFGATYSPKRWLNGKTWITQQVLKLDSKADTLTYNKTNSLYSLPNSYGAGISYEYERTSRLRVEFDYTWQEWSKATYSSLNNDYGPNATGNEIFKGMNFNNRIKYAAGMEYVPSVRGNYLERIAYRCGAYYTHDYLNIRGNKVREFGITAGLGLNTPQDKTTINIGLEWKHRQAYPQALISENYLNLTIGLNFNELWFYQRKIK